MREESALNSLARTIMVYLLHNSGALAGWVDNFCTSDTNVNDKAIGRTTSCGGTRQGILLLKSFYNVLLVRKQRDECIRIL